jgi:hypothetical protein
MTDLSVITRLHNLTTCDGSEVQVRLLRDLCGLRMYVDSRIRVATQNLMASSVRYEGTYTSVARIFM